MALIPCPNCGQTISDQARKCIHCDYVLRKDEVVVCPECGAIFMEDIDICSECGYPIQEKRNRVVYNSPQNVSRESENRNSSGKRKAMIAIICICAAVIAAVVAGTLVYRNIQQKEAEEAAIAAEEAAIAAEIAEQEAAEAAAQEAAALIAEYEENLEDLVSIIYESGNSASDCGDLLLNVWHDSIFEELDIETFMYTKEDGGTGDYYDDFNDAISALYSSSDFASSIKALSTTKSNVTYKMKNMQDPPDDDEDAYECLEDFYDAYLALVDLVVSPTGSYNTYMSEFNSAKSTFTTAYSKMQVYVD